MEDTSMVSEIITTLAILSPLASLIFGYFSFNHARKKQEQEETTQMITVINKLETIGDNIKDIKSDLYTVKQDVGTLAERVAKAEAAISAAHHRLDDLVNRK